MKKPGDEPGFPALPHQFHANRNIQRALKSRDKPVTKAAILGYLPHLTVPKGVANHMWIKVFVLLRLPVSVISLLGYPAVLSAWGGYDMAFLGGVFVVGLYIFLAFTSIRLVRLRKGALSLAWWLLALETIGAVILVSAGGYMATGTFEPFDAFATACIVIVVWTLPNALGFYRQRANFT